MEREDFVIARNKLHPLRGSNRKILQRVEKLFSTNVEVSNTGDPSGEWITVRGSKENINRTKDYIISLCDPEEEVAIPYPDELHEVLMGDAHRSIEWTSSAVVTFHNGTALVQGLSLAVVMAVSIIESLISPSVENSPPVSVSDKTQVLLDGISPTSSFSIQDELERTLRRHHSDMDAAEFTSVPDNMKYLMVEQMGMLDLQTSPLDDGPLASTEALSSAGASNTDTAPRDVALSPKANGKAVANPVSSSATDGALPAGNSDMPSTYGSAITCANGSANGSENGGANGEGSKTPSKPRLACNFTSPASGEQRKTAPTSFHKPAKRSLWDAPPKSMPVAAPTAEPSAAVGCVSIATAPTSEMATAIAKLPDAATISMTTQSSSLASYSTPSNLNAPFLANPSAPFACLPLSSHGAAQPGILSTSIAQPALAPADTLTAISYIPDGMAPLQPTNAAAGGRGGFSLLYPEVANRSMCDATALQQQQQQQHQAGAVHPWQPQVQHYSHQQGVEYQRELHQSQHQHQQHHAHGQQQQHQVQPGPRNGRNRKHHGQGQQGARPQTRRLRDPTGHPTGKRRPIVIDGSNVAMTHGNGKCFSCKGIKIAVEWFELRGHDEITAFVPNFRQGATSPDTVDQHILQELKERGRLTFTPSRKIERRLVVSYDDRFIVRLADVNGGVVVSNDQYRDLLRDNPAWTDVIQKHLLPYVFVGDIFMPPDDPLGRSGPDIDRFLRF